MWWNCLSFFLLVFFLFFNFGLYLFLIRKPAELRSVDLIDSYMITVMRDYRIVIKVLCVIHHISVEFIVLEALGVRLRLQGARVAHMLHAGVTHVVCSPHCSARILLIQVTPWNSHTITRITFQSRDHHYLNLSHLCRHDYASCDITLITSTRSGSWLLPGLSIVLAFSSIQVKHTCSRHLLQNVSCLLRIKIYVKFSIFNLMKLLSLCMQMRRTKRT